jgi:TIR domain
MPKVFISHSTQDRPFVEDELLPLLTRHGIDVWYAPDDIRSSSVWERTILDGLKACDWFALVMSPRSAESEWVKDELQWAIEFRTDRIVPILLEPCVPYEFHIRLARIQHVDFTISKIDTSRSKLLANWNVHYSPTASRSTAAETVFLKEDHAATDPSQDQQSSKRRELGKKSPRTTGNPPSSVGARSKTVGTPLEKKVTSETMESRPAAPNRSVAESRSRVTINTVGRAGTPPRATSTRESTGGTQQASSKVTEPEIDSHDELWGRRTPRHRYSPVAMIVATLGVVILNAAILVAASSSATRAMAVVVPDQSAASSSTNERSAQQP